ncbi:MAG: hypothetical protein P1V35_08225 [Planctomycetota bacterium]|nr:hypothetical protein [Planctomycetota bacterium]
MKLNLLGLALLLVLLSGTASVASAQAGQVELRFGFQVHQNLSDSHSFPNPYTKVLPLSKQSLSFRVNTPGSSVLPGVVYRYDIVPGSFEM